MRSETDNKATKDTVLADLVSRVDVPVFVDARGRLESIEYNTLPFTPQRLFIVSDVPPGVTRGRHAHRSGYQLLMCLFGAVRVSLHYRDAEQQVYLTPEEPGLLIQAGVWSEQCYVGPDAALLVLASEPYNADSYIQEKQ